MPLKGVLWHKLPIAMLSFPLAEVFNTKCIWNMKMYFKYIKYMQIVFQLQNTNYFCWANKIQNTKYMKCISITYFNYLYFNYYTTLVHCICTYCAASPHSKLNFIRQDWNWNVMWSSMEMLLLIVFTVDGLCRIQLVSAVNSWWPRNCFVYCYLESRSKVVICMVVLWFY